MSNVGQAAVTLAGLYVGSMVGMPGLGASLGNMLGQALFPTQLPTVEGPKIADQAVTSSAVGAAWPWVFGRDAVAGNVLWADKLINHKHTEEVGGKGGPTQKQVYYTATRSYAVGLCRCPNGPIKGLLRAWRMDKVVYDIRPQQPDETVNAYAERVAASEAFAEGFTLYLGTADQMPDPTIEAVKGVGNTPAYRSRAYIVFTDEDQTDTGGRMPNWRFEIITEGDDVDTAVVQYSPAVLSPWSATQDPRRCANVHEYRFFGVSGDQMGAYPWRSCIDAAMADAAAEGIDTDRLSQYLGWSPDGVELSVAWPANTPGEKEVLYFHYNRHIPDRINDLNQYLDGVPAVGIAGCSGFQELGISAGRRVWWSGYYENGSPAFGGRSGIYRVWPFASAEPQEESFNHCTNYGSGQQLLGLIDVLIEVRRKPRIPAPPCAPYCADGYPLLPENSNYCGIDGRVEHTIGFSVASGTFKALANYRIAGGVVTDYPLGPLVISGGPDDNQAAWESRYSQALADGEVIRPGLAYGVDYPVVPSIAYTRSYVRHALQAIPPTVGSIVREICQEVEIPVDRIDVSDLTDTVPGYGLSTLMTARQAIQPLQAYQFFDCVESDALLKFPKRGKPIVYTLTADELGARFAGETPPPLVTTQIQQAVELPRYVRVHYKMGAKDYQAGMQQSPPRMTTDSVNAKDVQLAINMDDTKARQIAQVIHQDDWWGRETYETSVTPALLAIECADAVGIPVEGQIERARIVGVNMAPPLSSLKWSLRRDDDGVYVSHAVGAAAPPSDDALGIAGPSELLVIDGPALNAAANDAGVYVAAWGQFSRWAGAQVMRSTDDGASYKVAATVLTPATVGRVVGVMPAGPSANVWDYGTVLIVDLDTGSLAAHTPLDVLNGANPAFIGADGRWEACQFVTPTLVGVVNGKNRYEIRQWLRGRRGTEWAQGLHQAGDRFVLVGAGVVRVPGSASDIGRTLHWKAVTLDTSEQATAAVGQVARGVALEAFSVARITAVRDANNNILIQFVPRSRMGLGEWQDGVDATPTEQNPQYKITFIDSAGAGTANPFEGGLASNPHYVTVTERRYLYTFAQQQVDYYGRAPLNLTIQIEAYNENVGFGYPTRASFYLPYVEDENGNVPAQPATSWTFNFSGAFSVNDAFEFLISTGTFSRTLYVVATGLASLGDLAEELAAQLEAEFSEVVSVEVDGTEVSAIFAWAVNVRVSTNVVTEVNSGVAQAPRAPEAGVPDTAFIDLRGGSSNREVSPDYDSAYLVNGYGSVGLYLFPRDYATSKADGGARIEFPSISWPVYGSSTYYLEAVAGLADAINANSDFSSRGVAASVGLVSDTQMVRPSVVLTASGDYGVAGLSNPGTGAFGTHPSGFQPFFRQLSTGVTEAPAGLPQISRVSFRNFPSPNVLAGQVYVVTLDGVDYEYTADVSDEGTSFGPIYDGLAAEINLSADFTAVKDTSFPTMALEITHNTINTPFTVSTRASYGAWVTAEKE